MFSTVSGCLFYSLLMLMFYGLGLPPVVSEGYTRLLSRYRCIDLLNPRHPNTSCEDLRRYLDPKNIAKKPSQEVFGCLGKDSKNEQVVPRAPKSRLLKVMFLKEQELGWFQW